MVGMFCVIFVVPLPVKMIFVVSGNDPWGKRYDLEKHAAKNWNVVISFHHCGSDQYVVVKDCDRNSDCASRHVFDPHADCDSYEVVIYWGGGDPRNFDFHFDCGRYDGVVVDHHYHCGSVRRTHCVNDCRVVDHDLWEKHSAVMKNDGHDLSGKHSDDAPESH